MKEKEIYKKGKKRNGTTEETCPPPKVPGMKLSLLSSAF